MNIKTGTLFIVATPIGNLSDMSQRAISVLSDVDLILAEDTRHAGKLLSHFDIHSKTRSFHEHNENQNTQGCVDELRSGKNIALISDAGTPLISDPGYRLVKACREQNITVSPVPGACAFAAALSAAGLATDRFCFEGFLPSKSSQRLTQLESLKYESRTLIFYESSHRIVASLKDMSQVFGDQTMATVGREISKKFEHFYYGLLDEVRSEIQSAADHQKGEFVVMLSVANDHQAEWLKAVALMDLLVTEMSPRKACTIVASTFPVNKNALYDYALGQKSSS